jgi:spore cortex biosynthesis protein YabQ
MSLNLQALTMLHMVGAGIWVGIALETYTRLRIKGRPWLTLLQDVSFWLLNAGIVFLWLLYVNQGQMRLHVFLSLLCGFALYQALLQSYYRSLLERLIRFVSWIFRLLYTLWRMLIYTPIQWLYRAMVALLLLFFSGSAMMVRGIYLILRYIALQLWKLGRLLAKKAGMWLGKIIRRKPQKK